jgi:hypothetical protein
MPKILTETSQLNCPHGGKVQATAGQAKLRVGGSRVLVAGDVAGKQVAACLTAPAPQAGTLKCLTAVSLMPPGVSSKLRVGGKGVLLDTATGLTDGAVAGVPQSWSVGSANQLKVEAR